MSPVFEHVVSGYIPEPPPILDESIILNAIGEPSLHSIGLASYITPPGWVQNALEFLHADIGLPWLQTIALFAVTLRMCLVPLNVLAQRSASKMRKFAPQMKTLNERITEAQVNGDQMECEQHEQRLNTRERVFYMFYTSSNNRLCVCVAWLRHETLRLMSINNSSK